MKKITKDMTIGEIIEKNVKNAEVMLKHGLHCIGCHVATWETLEQGANAHGMSDKDINSMLNELNKTISKKG